MLIRLTNTTNTTYTTLQSPGPQPPKATTTSPEMVVQQNQKHKKTLQTKTTTAIVSSFLQLTLEIPEKPLFRDEDGGLVIPQEPLVKVLKKLNGVTYTDVTVPVPVPVAVAATDTKNTVTTKKRRLKRRVKRRYELLELPDYLILHLARFKKSEHGTTNNNNISNTASKLLQRREKNPSIVVFPLKNLDLTPYVVVDDPSSSNVNAVRVPTQNNFNNLVTKKSWT